MPWDDDADDDAGGAHPPLPPEDRLWRHPSELGPAVAPVPQAPGRPARWPVAVVAGLVGASLSAGLIAAMGSLPSRVVERSVVEKVALTPIVSSPMVRGDRGIAAIAERLGPAVARLDIETAEGMATGSAVLFRDDGLLLTSAQLISSATSVTVVLRDGRSFDGEIVGADRITDVAVVRIEGEGLPVAVIGSTSDLTVGAPTVVVGSASEAGDDSSVTTGVISALQRRVESGSGWLHGLIEVDEPIAAGASGGALVDAAGAVIGIATTPTDEPDGPVGFAIPIDLARRIADDLVVHGRAAHGWLGVHAEDLTRAELRDLGIESGALVRDVAGGSPAAAAGLEPDDVIVDLDGEEVDSTSSLVLELREHGPGDEVVVRYWRDGREEERTVTLGERP